MIGLAMMRAMKMALSIDAGYPSLMLSYYLNGPQIETGFDFFPIIKTCVAQHQQNGMMNRQLRTFSLFCLKCCVFEFQLYLAAAYSIQYFSPYTSIWYECYLLRHLKKAIRHYRMMWDCNSPWKNCSKVSNLYKTNNKRHHNYCTVITLFWNIFLYSVPGVHKDMPSSLTKGSDPNR